MVASVTVGTGETIFSPRLGAIFGYQMLWVILAAVIFKGVLVYTGGRHLVLTGEHPMEAWARLPGPRAWFSTLIGGVALVSFPLWVAALTDAVSSLCVWMSGWGRDTPIGRPLWSTAIILTARGSCRRTEIPRVPPARHCPTPFSGRSPATRTSISSRTPASRITTRSRCR